MEGLGEGEEQLTARLLLSIPLSNPSSKEMPVNKHGTRPGCAKAGSVPAVTQCLQQIPPGAGCLTAPCCSWARTAPFYRTPQTQDVTTFHDSFMSLDFPVLDSPDHPKGLHISKPKWNECKQTLKVPLNHIMARLGKMGRIFLWFCTELWQFQDTAGCQAAPIQ